MNILKWIYILYLTQIKILRQKLCVDKAFNKLIIRWTYQTTQINELASLNDTFKIGSECEGWGQNNVAWSGVGGGGGQWLQITLLILLFLECFCFLREWKTFRNEKLIFDYINFHIWFSYLLYIDKTKELIHKIKFLGQLLN